MALVSRKKMKSLLAIGMVLSALGTTASAAVLQVDTNGQLTGATGITVGMSDYDVTFVDGSFNQLVADGDLHIEFATDTLALDAANALLAQVFNQNDDLSAHPGVIPNFDSDPELTFGITDVTATFFGIIITPYSTDGTDVSGAATNNWTGLNPDSASLGSEESVSDDISGPDITSPFTVYANWSPASKISAVPEPSTYAMMALGLLGIAGMRRRQNQA